METDKHSKPLNNTTLKKIYILIVFVLTVMGMYFFGLKVTNDKLIAVILAGCLAVGLLILVIVGVCSGKMGKQRHFIGAVTLILLTGILLVNGYLLISSYFIAHITTTIHNRYFPSSMEHSWQLETYLTGKTLYVDASNDFIGRAEDELTPIDHVNTVAMLSSVNGLETLDAPFGKLTAKQIDFLLKDKNAYYITENTHNRHEKIYLYEALNSEFDKVVFLQDDADNAYFVPYQVFMALKDIG